MGTPLKIENGNRFGKLTILNEVKPSPVLPDVFWDKDKDKWCVCIGKNLLGRFHNFYAAVYARLVAEVELYGFNLKH